MRMNLLVYIFAVCLAGTFLFTACSVQTDLGRNTVSDEIPNSANLILQPTAVGDAADQLDDAALLAIFEETLCPNAVLVYSFMNDEGIQTDEGTMLAGTPDGTNYVSMISISDTMNKRTTSTVTTTCIISWKAPA